MSENNASQDVEVLAQQLLQDRLTAVRELAERRRVRDEKQDALDAAERDYAETWARAERAGWSAAELKKVGLAEPAKRRPGRPVKKPRPPAPVEGV